MNKKECFLSIVIPAYNEEKRIGKILDAIIEYKKDCTFDVEVIVVLDGTPDDTLNSVKEYEDKLSNLKIIDRKENKGKGYTVKEGVLAAHGKYILFADADNSTPLEQVDQLLDCVNKYEVVIGSRYIKGAKLVKPQPLFRIVGSRFLNMVIRTLATRGIKDTQCGFKLFEKNAARRIFERITFNRWSFDIEILAIARNLGYKVKEVGITWYDDPHSSVNPIKDGLRMLKDSVLVRLNIWKGRYR